MSPFQCPWAQSLRAPFSAVTTVQPSQGRTGVHTQTLWKTPDLSPCSTLPIHSGMNQLSGWHKCTSSSCPKVDVNQNSEVLLLVWINKPATYFSKLTSNSDEQSWVICIMDMWLICWAGWQIADIPPNCHDWNPGLKEEGQRHSAVKLYFKLKCEFIQ